MTDLTRIPEYNETAVALADLKTRYAAVVFDVSTGKGMTQAKEARAELRGYRLALEAKRKEIKEPALTRCREIDSEAKRITAELESMESPIDATIKAEEQRKEREKAEREAAEAERVRVQTEWFDAVKAMPFAAMGRTVAEIEAIEAKVAALNPDSLNIIAGDMKAAAAFTIRNAIAQLRAARDARQADDGRQAQIDADLAELAKRREQDEADQRAREEVAYEQARIAQAAADARDREERAAREAEAARERAEREEAERARQAEIAAERQKIADERAALEAQRVAEEKRQAAARAKLEADKKAVAKAKRDAEIAGATLAAAASEAVALLRELGQGEHLVTLKLSAALNRETRAAA